MRKVPMNLWDWAFVLVGFLLLLTFVWWLSQGIMDLLAVLSFDPE